MDGDIDTPTNFKSIPVHLEPDVKPTNKKKAQKHIKAKESYDLSLKDVTL